MCLQDIFTDNDEIYESKAAHGTVAIAKQLLAIVCKLDFM